MAKRKKAKTKLSIYLLKEGFSMNFLKEGHDLTEDENNEGIYTGVMSGREPRWVRDFFISKDLELETQSVSVVYKTKFNINDDEKHFVICFGGGHHRLNPDSYEKRFGLKTALSMGDIEKVRAINKKDISGTPKIAQEQLASTATINSFTIDFQQDILQGITISLNQNTYPKDKYGKTIDGRDALSITTSSNVNDIEELLRYIYKIYEKQEYKNRGYDWIDNINQVKAPNEIEVLNNLLLEEIKLPSNHLVLAPPELVNWSDFEGFSKKASEVEQDDIFDDIELHDFIPNDELENIQSIQKLKDIRVNLIGSERDSVRAVWKLFDCINAEIDNSGKKFILTSGNWYEVEVSFLTEVEKWWNSLTILDSNLPRYEKNNGKHDEGHYNSGQKGNYEVLDEKFIQLPRRSKVEVCDLYKDGQFIHVKIYKSSSDISHLMAQALVSANLFVGEEQFRRELNERLIDKIEEAEVQNPTRNNYKVILGIITNKADFNLPFFSKINLRTNMQHIQRYGLNCSIEKIEGDY